MCDCLCWGGGLHCRDTLYKPTVIWQGMQCTWLCGADSDACLVCMCVCEGGGAAIALGYVCVTHTLRTWHVQRSLCCSAASAFYKHCEADQVTGPVCQNLPLLLSSGGCDSQSHSHTPQTRSSEDGIERKHPTCLLLLLVGV
jgi:hypothetical protein